MLNVRQTFQFVARFRDRGLTDHDKLIVVRAHPMQRFSHRTQSFDCFTLDQTRGCLFRDTQEIKLRPKPFEALKYLVENPGRLISKAELIQTIWPDTAVTDDSLVQCLMEVR
jgi:DNA-binding winged helix-turn-helix (wHTH) protein